MKKTTKVTKKVIHRSSKTGKLVTQDFAEKHPATTEKEVVRVVIENLSASFGQEDLNKVVDKINEIIAFCNRVL